MLINDVEKAVENVLKKHPEDAAAIRSLFARVHGDLQAKNYTACVLTPSFNAKDENI
jgi:hypothetical protein